MYLRIADGEPEAYSITDLKAANPGVSWPRVIPAPTLAEYDVYPYTMPSQPSFDAGTEVVEPGAFSQVDGAWVRAWVKRDKTAEELASERAAMITTKIALKRACEQQADWKGMGGDLWAIASAAIATLSADQQENWELATRIERVNSDFEALAKSPAIGATDAEIDAVFRLAMTLE